jgi:hypothetical protein
LHEHLIENAFEVEHTPKQIRSIISNCLIEKAQNLRWEESELSDDEIINEQPNDLVIPQSDTVSRVYRDLVDSGWLVEMEERGYRIIVFMPRLAAAVFDALQSVSMASSESVGAKCQFIFNALESACISPQENAATLFEAVDMAKKYCRSLGSIVSQVRELTAQIIDEHKPSEVFRLFFDEFASRIMLSDFKNISGSDHPYRFRDKVLRLNLEIDRVGPIREGFILGIVKERVCTREEAELALSNLTMSIHNSFEKMDLLVQKIQSHATNVTERATETAKYIIFSNPGSSDSLKKMITAVNLSAIDEFDLPCLRSRVLDQYGLYKPPMPKAKAEAVKEIVNSVPDSEIALQRAMRDRLAARTIYPDRVEQYLEKLLKNKDSILTDECTAESLDDLMALIHLRDMTDITEHSDHVLADLQKRYTVSKEDGSISNTDIMVAPTLKISRVK